MPETLAQRLQKAVNQVLHPLGLHLARSRQAFGMEDLLYHASRQGIAPRTIIDVGASDGIWSLRARRIFPSAKFLLFEPLDEHRAKLERLNRSHGFLITHAVAGEKSSTASLHVGSDIDGSGITQKADASTRQVPMETVDSIIAKHALPEPYLLKLDTHGYEVPVLDGAHATLNGAALIIVESYNFKLTENCLRFHELCAWMESRGFRCIGVADPRRRPGDGVLWQMDLAFARADNPAFANSLFS